MRDREALEAIQKKELEEIITLFEKLALVSKESESGPTMNVHELKNCELEFDLNNSYTPTKEEIISILDGGGDSTINEPTEEVDNVQI